MFVFSQSPQFGHLLGVDELELALVVGPSYDGLVLLFVNKKFEQKLPQRYVGLHLGGAGRRGSR